MPIFVPAAACLAIIIGLLTPADFRNLALQLPGVEEKSHMNHPDFRVNGRIIATLGAPNVEYAMVQLTADQQKQLLTDYPQTFTPAAGAWGAKGSTLIKLAVADPGAVRQAIHHAWTNRADVQVRKTSPRRVGIPSSKQ